MCVSYVRRGHANLLCIVPILTDDPRRESKASSRSDLIRPRKLAGGAQAQDRKAKYELQQESWLIHGTRGGLRTDFRTNELITSVRITSAGRCSRSAPTRSARGLPARMRVWGFHYYHHSCSSSSSSRIRTRLCARGRGVALQLTRAARGRVREGHLV